MVIVQLIFWLAAAFIAYAYVGFPLLLLARGFVLRRPISKRRIVPSVSLIVIAHNEEESIGAKLDNILDLDYPRDKLHVIVGSDGSDDCTDEVVRGYADQGVELMVCPRQGKIPALNAVVARATGDILVFSDANSMFSHGALRALTRNFADGSVGAVAGDQCYTTDHGNAASTGERLFWNFDRFLKTQQSISGSVTSSTGAIHAIRRELFQPVPLGVCDDFFISTRAINARRRIVFEPEAIASEPVSPTDGAEYKRKTRVITRGLRGLWTVRRLFNPFKFGFYSVQLFSHKLLRRSVIWLMFVLFISSAILAEPGTIYGYAFAAQLLFYCLAVMGAVLRGTSIARAAPFKLVAIPYYFCLANAAVLPAWWRLLAGRRVDTWDSNRNEQESLQSNLNRMDANTA